MNRALTPFHVAVRVHDLAAARQFYGELLACPEGRSADRWVDFDLFGHQFVAHLDDRMEPPAAAANPVDGHEVPVPHYGVVMELADWRALADRLQAAGATFVIEPYVRFEGLPGEQGTMFLRDPSGNCLEFKGFADIDSQLFATE